MDFHSYLNILEFGKLIIGTEMRCVSKFLLLTCSILEQLRIRFIVDIRKL